MWEGETAVACVSGARRASKRADHCSPDCVCLLRQIAPSLGVTVLYCLRADVSLCGSLHVGSPDRPVSALDQTVQPHHVQGPAREGAARRGRAGGLSACPELAGQPTVAGRGRARSSRGVGVFRRTAHRVVEGIAITAGEVQEARLLWKRKHHVELAWGVSSSRKVPHPRTGRGNGKRLQPWGLW